MGAQHLWLFCVVVLFHKSVASVHPTTAPIRDDLEKRVTLFDGVQISIPKENNTRRLISLELDTHRSLQEGRGKQKKLMERILPLFIMPFLIQSTIIPFFLSMLKFMLFKSLMVGKLALTLIILNAFRNHNVVKGRDAEMANVVYGYHGDGMGEYGAYIN